MEQWQGGGKKGNPGIGRLGIDGYITVIDGPFAWLGRHFLNDENLTIVYDLLIMMGIMVDSYRSSLIINEIFLPCLLIIFFDSSGCIVLVLVHVFVLGVVW